MKDFGGDFFFKAGTSFTQYVDYYLYYYFRRGILWQDLDVLRYQNYNNHTAVISAKHITAGTSSIVKQVDIYDKYSS